MQKASLTCFGVGDGWPCADRNHAAFLYRFGRNSILIDCGEPVDRCLKASGLSYNSIDSLFISHLHADHFGGLFMLMQGFWLEGRRRDLPVYMPGGAIKPLKRMLDTAFLFDELLKFRLQLSGLKTGKTVNVGQVRITPFPTTHLDGLRASFQKKHRSDFSAYSFLLESGRYRVGHSADIGSLKDLDLLLRKPLDLLVCELAHFAPEDLFLYLRNREIRRVVFVHVARSSWKNLPKLRRLAAKMLPDLPHAFAGDNQRFDF